MTSIAAEGHGLTATLTDDALHIRATGRLVRGGLFGFQKDDSGQRRSEITLPLAEIAAAEHRKRLLVLHTNDGRRYRLQYASRRQTDFPALADQVVAAVTAARSA